jgi:hypothetical protein
MDFGKMKHGWKYVALTADGLVPIDLKELLTKHLYEPCTRNGSA